MNKSQHIIEIELDTLPGWGHRVGDHTTWLKQSLGTQIPHYHPKVTGLLDRLTDMAKQAREARGYVKEPGDVYDQALVDLIMRVTDMPEEHRDDVMHMIGLDPNPPREDQYWSGTGESMADESYIRYLNNY